MTYSENLWLFFLLLTGIIVVPGMDMVFVLASALSGGRKAGLPVSISLDVCAWSHRQSILSEPPRAGSAAASAASSTRWSPRRSSCCC